MRPDPRAARLDDAVAINLRLPTVPASAPAWQGIRQRTRSDHECPRVSGESRDAGLGAAGQCLRLRDSVAAGSARQVRVERFVIVGALCALLSNAAVIGLVRSGFGTLSASLLAFGPVLITGYTLHSVFTFGTTPARLTFARYALATAANFPIWIAALYVFVDVLKIQVGIAAPVATALIFLWSYIAARWAWGSERWMPWKR